MKKTTPVSAKKVKKKRRFDIRYFMRGVYYTIRNKPVVYLLGLFICGLVIGFLFGVSIQHSQKTESTPRREYWFFLKRKSEKEYLYKGIPGDKKNSILIKVFSVKTGIPGERPTPLPKLLGREYWMITQKYELDNNPELGQYFIELNIPYSFEYPFGPSPYTECVGLTSTLSEGVQCDWVVPGPFGLHGVNNNTTRLSSEDPGSSGCIRHSDKDIQYLYKIIGSNFGQRYYIEDV